MKLISFEYNNKASFGVLTDKGIADLSGSDLGGASDLKSFLEGDVTLQKLSELAESAESYIDVKEVTYLPVIPNPGAIFCVGMNTKSHVKEVAEGTGGAEKYPPKPMFFQRTARAQAAHEQPLEKPNGSPLFDYEGEIAIVIGKFGRHIKQEDALDYVAGYACYNDGSIRDYQLHSPFFTAGKNFPRTGGFGPYLVTKDEACAPEDMVLTTKLNGNVVQKMTYDDLIFNFNEIISYLSEFTELHPGDVIVTGSAAGVALFAKPQRWMRDGDTLEVEVKSLGRLSNPIQEASGKNRAPVTRDNAEEVFKEAISFVKGH